MRKTFYGNDKSSLLFQVYFENKLLLDKSLKAEICDEKKSTGTMNCDDEDMNHYFYCTQWSTISVVKDGSNGKISLPSISTEERRYEGCTHIEDMTFKIRNVVASQRDMPSLPDIKM